METRGWRRWADGVGRRLWRLDAARLCDEARQRTGLSEFGEPAIEPALLILTDSLEREARLHSLGRFLMRSHLRELLENRLRLTEAWRGKQELLKASEIRRPVFITGMPRSGSTFLHELLSRDPDNRAPEVWEVMFPVPAPEAERRHTDPRIRKTAACLWWFRRIAPWADSVYPMRARTPHECVAIHSHTFLSEEFVTTCRIPAYEAYLRSEGLAPAYQFQKRFLQHLQLRCPTKRWILKSPDHAYGLEELFAVFPDAVVIQTHRNPLEVLRSSSQLVASVRGLFARSGDRDQIAAREARVLGDAMERFIHFRDVHPELAERFIDVKYTELAADPLAEVRRIYRKLGIPLSDETTGRIQEMVATRSRYRGHRGRLTLKELGFDVPAEARRFSEYSLRFGVPCQLVS